MPGYCGSFESLFCVVCDNRFQIFITRIDGKSPKYCQRVGYSHVMEFYLLIK